MIFGHEWFFYPAFFAIGALASLINSIAGGGSSISLPLMIFCGLPPTVANGTNRLGLLVGDIASAVHLFRRGLLDVGLFRRLIVPTIFGALIGVGFLVKIDDKLFQGILSVAIFLVVVMSNIKRNFLGKLPASPPGKMSIFAFIGFALISVYGSIVQIGIGFVQIIALSRYTGMDNLRVNALKNALTGAFLLVGTVGLLAMGMVDWPLAVCVSAGALCGGVYGSRLQCKKGSVFVGRFISVASLGLAVILVRDLFG